MTAGFAAETATLIYLPAPDNTQIAPAHTPTHL